MFFRKKQSTPATLGTPLGQEVVARMPDSDEETQRLVTSVAGLLACVAYADHDFDPREIETVKQELTRLRALDESGVAAIMTLLTDHVAILSAEGDQLFARDILDLCERDVRLEVLEALLEIAAADDELTLAETNYLRRLVPMLGLSQEEYTALQARHADKLSVLRS